jgi:hypothetical protein
MKKLRFYDAVRHTVSERSRVRDDDNPLAGYDIAAEYDSMDYHAITFAGKVYVVRKKPHEVGITDPLKKQTVGDRVARTIQAINAANKAYWNQK